MPVIHFKLAYRGNTYRFAPTDSEQQLFEEVHDRVAKIVHDEAFKLYWNDGDSNVLLGTVDDLATACDFAVSGATSGKPPCVHLTVKVMQAADMESEVAASDAAAVEVQPTAAPAAETAAMAPAVKALLEFHKQQGIKMEQQLGTSNATRTAIISSFRIHQDPATSDVRLQIHFDYASEYSLWEGCVTSVFKHLNIPENSLAIDKHRRKLLLTVPSEALDQLLKFLHPLAIETRFIHVQVTGGEKILRSVARFLKRANVDQLTLTQEDDYKEKYDHWYRLISRVKPTKLRVNRINVAQELMSFLMHSSDLVDSIWVGSSKSKEAFPSNYIRLILRGRKCSQVHISDSTTDIPITMIELLAELFVNTGKPGTIIVPSTQGIQPKRYELSHTTLYARNHEKEKNRVIIEHFLRK